MTSGYTLSSLSKARIACVVQAVVVVFAVIVGLAVLDVGLWGVILLLVCLLPGIAAFLYIGKVFASVRSATAACSRIAGGDYEARIIGNAEGGDLQALYDSINNIIDRSDAFLREAVASMKAASQHRYYRRILEGGMPGNYLVGTRTINEATASMEERVKKFGAMADTFEDTVHHVVETVVAATVELHATAETMEETASTASSQADAVAAAAEMASSNVQTVASAAEELSTSVQEISRQVVQSTAIAGNAVAEAARANQMVQSLADAASRIGEVVGLITNIANQTNMLALNATIEAARAGDAGKGFAVVAGEVKNLASQTAKATEEIGAQIVGVQNATQGAVEAIQGIGGIITRMNEIAAAIAAAVEEQGAATQEIARNMQQAAAGTQDVSSNIAGVQLATGKTGESACLVRQEADQLSQQSNNLSSEVDAFFRTVRQQ